MNSVTADSTAVMRIAALLDEGSFVEIGWSNHGKIYRF